MPFAPHDYMIMHRDAQWAACFCDSLRNADIGAAWLWIAAGMVVDKDERRRPDVQPPPNHFARMDRGFIHSAVSHQMIQQQAIARVEIEHPHTLHMQMAHINGEIIQQ